MSRIYDAQNPRMLTDEELARLSPAECAAACEQLDQNILSTLVSIDSNFVETTRTITDVLLPLVEKYGRSSKQIWDSVKLWKAFFEAAAGVSSVPGENEEDYADPAAYEHEEADTTARDTHDREDIQESNTTAVLESVQPTKNKSQQRTKRVSTTPPSSDEDEDDLNREHEFHVPPRKPGRQVNGKVVEPSWADEESPFEQLRQDIQKVRLDASYSTSSTSYHAPPFAPSSIAAKKQQQKLHDQHQKDQQQQQQQKSQSQNQKAQQTRLRDLSLDSPDFERPALQTMSFQHPHTQQYAGKPQNAPSHAGSSSKGKGRAVEEDSYQDYQHHIQNPSAFFRDGDTADATSSVPDTPASMSTLSDLSSLGGPSGGESRPDMPRRKSSSNQNALLQKVLMKNLVGKDGRPNLSTPATKKLSKSMNKAARSRGPEGGEEEGFFPADLPKDWNGLADLSKVALSSFDSPQKSSARQRDGRNLPSASKIRAPQSSASTKMGLPSSVSSDSLFDNSIFREGPESSKAGESYQPPAFSVYKSKLSRTPAKEAARLITRDVLQSANLRSGGDWHDAGPDSPMLDPPSVVKNWATRGYTTHFSAAAHNPEKAAPGVEDLSSRKPQLLVPLAEGEGEDSFEAEFDDDAPLPQLNFGHLADEGDEIGGGGIGVGQREQSGNVDDWGDSFEGQSGEDDNSGFDEPAQVPLNDMHDEEGDSFSDNSRSLDDETVFGAKRGPSLHAPSGYGLDPQQQALDPNSRQAHLFRLQAQNDMVTLHGGNLLESQPFEASPLAGRDARYGL